MKIMLIGSADMSGKTIGGQYEKTRLVYNFLVKEKNVDVIFCNMFDIGRTIGLVSSVIKDYFKCDCIVVITSTRGTKVISRMLYYFQLFRKKVVVYLIVGNQQSLLRALPKKVAKKMDKVYFEVASMQEELRDKFNVGFFSNCKDIQIECIEHMQTIPAKICYYSEISYRKGFDRIIHALDIINQESIKYELDVYGFFSTDEKEMKKYFESRLYIHFKGIIKREQAAKILSQYSFMVFPSRHKLEGVPGAIVDAYESGLPVICSNVGFLPQVVKNSETGYIFKNEEQLIEIMNNVYDKPEMIDELRENVLREAWVYDIKKSIKRLYIDLMQMK